MLRVMGEATSRDTEGRPHTEKSMPMVEKAQMQRGPRGIAPRGPFIGFIAPHGGGWFRSLRYCAKQ